MNQTIYTYLTYLKNMNLKTFVIIFSMFWIFIFLSIIAYGKISDINSLSTDEIPVLNKDDKRLLGSPVIFKGEKYYVSEVNYWKYTGSALIHLEKWND